MSIHVKVKPNSSEQKIVPFGDNRYLVYLTSEPENNKANIELINLLAKQFTTPAARIKIKFGLNSREKILEIR